MQEFQISQDEKAFLGRGWSYPLKFNWETKSVRMVSAEEDIEESLFILLNTMKKERIMRPDFGCDLMLMVYEKMDNSFENIITDYIRTAITLYESRIEIENILVQENQMEGAMHVDLTYVIRATNSRRNMVFPFYLTQGTQIDHFEHIHDTE